MWPMNIKSKKKKKRSFHVWLALWFAQSLVRPIFMSTFQSCWSSETPLKKKTLINDSYLWLWHEKEHGMPGRLAPFPEPNHFTSFGLLFLVVKTRSLGQKLLDPRRRTSYNLMNSFSTSVLQPTPNTTRLPALPSDPPASQEQSRRSSVLGWESPVRGALYYMNLSQ